MTLPTELAPFFAAKERRHRKLTELTARLGAVEQADTLVARLRALEALWEWLKTKDNSVPLPQGEPATDVPQTRRLTLLAAIMERSLAVTSVLRDALTLVFTETDGLPLFAEAGLPNDRGLIDETSDRLARRLLPKPRDHHDLSRFLERLLPKDRDVQWLDDIAPDLFLRLIDRLGAVDAAFEPAVTSISEAMGLLSARVQTLGLGEAMRVRRRPLPLRASPYFRLPRSTDALLENLHVTALALDVERAFRMDMEDCRSGTEEVLAELENTGVSVDVVYSLDVINRSLDRMQVLLSVLKASPGAEQSAAIHRLLVLLASARIADRSLRQLASENLRLLARKLVERAGRTGEHYITTTRREWFAMVASGAGGGVLTAGTAAMKVLISGAHFAPFVEGLLAGSNYAFSFALILFLGFTLATKQPSMTGAALAGVLRNTKGPSRSDDLATLVARMVRSQLAAAAGNVVVVAIVASAFDWLWLARTGANFMPPEKIDSVLEGMNPLRSGLVFYASLTGLILWLSSLVGGWAENFVVYRRIPLAIAEHRLGRVLGTRAMAALSRFFARNVSGYSAAVALGFMLGMTPVVGKFFGLPLDVRHVTLSTGTVALATFRMGAGVLFDPRVHMALIGIAITFVCNLGVSFFLALSVAMRARDVSTHDRWELLRAVAKRFFRSPLEFVFPPKNPRATPVTPAQRD